MGGAGSGREPSLSSRATTASTPSIAVADLYERWPGKPGELARTLGVDLGPARLEFRMQAGHASTYVCLVIDSGTRLRREHVVQVGWTEQHFGGQRPWFRCPECGRFCGRLYLVGLSLTCRRCAGLVYESQRLRREGRRLLRIERIFARLGVAGGMWWQIEKPARMHSATFDRLVCELRTLQSEVAAESGREALASLGSYQGMLAPEVLEDRRGEIEARLERLGRDARKKRRGPP